MCRRIRLIALFSIGFFLLAICIVRMVQGLQHAHFQLSRTMWASIELLFATIVACSPSIYCHIRRGRESTGITNMMPTTQRGSNSSARIECRMGKGTSHGSGNSHSIENGRSRFPGSIGGSTTSFTGGETRHSSIFSNYRNSGHGSCAGSRRNSSRNPSIASRHSIISRNFSVSSSRNMSFSSSRHSNTATGANKSRMGSYAGPNFDIPTYDGEIFPGFDAFGGHERGSVSASVWTYGGVMEEGKTEGDGGKEEKGGFYVIDEEEGKGLEGIMVDTTWNQVSEVDTECRPGASGIIQPPSRTITEEEEPEESGL
ncbi:hypothetical protein TWF132_005214 [Orbilia oligospora]|nr:hypothetical protein TWF751_000142 [Orbilia oligospora]KAF3292851.1 hypothetical protein TWF132_005214 [Orbilia oligospora]